MLTQYLFLKLIFYWCTPDLHRCQFLLYGKINCHTYTHIYIHRLPNSIPVQIIQFSRSVVSDSLRLYGLQLARRPCPSLTPGACSNLCPLSWWHHPTTSSSVVPFSSCLQSFPASGSFQMSQLFASGGQSTGVSASTSVLPMNTQDFAFCHKSGVISELVDISPSNLDSSLGFIQPGISHDVLCI